MKHNKITLIISFIISLLLITIGLSFAYFTANITNTEDSTTIHASGGVMNIHYDGGENINAPNIFPSNDPFATKNFSLTGNSTTNDNMNYHIILVIEENTFTNNALTYKLTSTNTDNNGQVAPSIIQTGIATGAQEIYLGDGTFDSPLNNKLHSYTIELYFPDTLEDQNDDMNKIFKAYVNIREGHYIFPGYNQEKGVNHPVLFTGMTPIKWNENNVEINTTEDDSDWYDYDEKRWANAKSLDGSYWVWIPRYAYKITSGYHSSETGTIDVEFLKGRSNVTIDNKIVETKGYVPNVKDTSMHYFLHPSFQFNEDELGFWMAKFEPTAQEGLDSGTVDGTCSEFDNTTTKTVLILPSTTSWRCINISKAYGVSYDMKNKYDVYGWLPDEVDTHLMTNTEWGAVAYLSKSQYGANGEVWINNSSDYVTGCAGDFVSADNQAECSNLYFTSNGVKASTTHNIYGIYDMSGSAYEMVMGNYNGLVGNSGFNNEKLFNIDTKYLIKYNTDESHRLNGVGMDYNKDIYGDAIFETSYNAAKWDGTKWEGEASKAWYNDDAYLPNTSRPWFNRGGHSNNQERAGVFLFHDSRGYAYIHTTFRPVIFPLQHYY